MVGKPSRKYLIKKNIKTERKKTTFFSWQNYIISNTFYYVTVDRDFPE